MTITPPAENPLEILVRRITAGTLSASPEDVALVAWVCDFTDVEPHFVSFDKTARGFFEAQPSDDSGATVFLGTPTNVLNQLALVCHTCGLTDAQTEIVLETARRKIS